jgi:hypothetical protein
MNLYDQLCIKSDVCDMAVCDGVNECKHAARPAPQPDVELRDYIVKAIIGKRHMKYGIIDLAGAQLASDDILSEITRRGNDPAPQPPEPDCSKEIVQIALEIERGAGLVSSTDPDVVECSMLNWARQLRDLLKGTP